MELVLIHLGRYRHQYLASTVLEARGVSGCCLCGDDEMLRLHNEWLEELGNLLDPEADTAAIDLRLQALRHASEVRARVLIGEARLAKNAERLASGRKELEARGLGDLLEESSQLHEEATALLDAWKREIDGTPTNPMAMGKRWFAFQDKHHDAMVSIARAMGAAQSVASPAMAAVLIVDVADSTTAMARAPVETAATLVEYRAAMRRVVEACHGRVVDEAGDGMRADFANPSDAVESGVEIQWAIAECHLYQPPRARLRVRVGIDLGTVESSTDGSAPGLTVHLAQRLQAEATPGTVMISAPVHDDAKNRLKFTYEDLGDYELRGIDRRVHVYRVRVARKPFGRERRAELARDEAAQRRAKRPRGVGKRPRRRPPTR